jgi:hypothetical protein
VDYFSKSCLSTSFINDFKSISNCFDIINGLTSLITIVLDGMVQKHISKATSETNRLDFGKYHIH